MIAFLLGSTSSLLIHRNDHLFYSEGLTIVKEANIKLNEINKMKLMNEKWANKFVKRTRLILDKRRPTLLEKRNDKEFKKLRAKTEGE